MIDDVLAALVSRHTGALAGARYTENGIELPVGEGLWGTADAIGPYMRALIALHHDTLGTPVR